MRAELRRLWARVRALWRRGELDAGMEREIRAHLRLMRDELERQGSSPEAARREAGLRYGSTEAAAERHRDLRGLAALEQLGKDARIAARSLRRAPGFTTAAVLALGLGLGATLAVFSVVNAVLLEPLPYPVAGRLVDLRQWAPGAGGGADKGDGLGLSESMYVTYAEHNRSFSALGIWGTPGGYIVSGRGRPERVRVVEMSNGVLQALGVAPMAGRWFGAEDENPHGAATVILSYGYWREKFGGARGVVGQTLRINDVPRTIIGILPRGFRVMDQDADLFLPIRIERTGLKLAGFGNAGIARLRSGVSIAAANRDLQGLLEVWMDSWSNGPGTDPHFYRRWHITPDLQPLKQALVGGSARVLWAILAGVGLVMLIAAGNVLNLFLVRAEARQQELAVRAALGAGRARMARSLMLESGLVAAASLGVGWLLAGLALGWLRAQGPGNLPRLEDVALGWPSLLLGAGLALGVAVLAGLAPVARGRLHLATVLGGEGQGASRERRRTRNFLTMGQMALALVLLVAAGLMLRSLAALRGVDSGMADPATLQYFRLSMPGHLDAGAIMRKQQSILERLAAVPGVRSVGLADQLPMQYSADWDIVVRRGEPFTAQSSPPAREFTFISPGFLGTAGIRLEAGRDFSWNDVYAKRPYVVISAGLARDFWGNPQSALGKELSASGPGQWNQVIGVAADVRSDGVGKPAPETLYWPALGANLWGRGVFAQNPATVVLRTPRAGSAALLTAMQQAVSRVDPDLPIYTVGTLQGLEAGKLATQAFTMAMLTLAGGMALALGLVGLYGVIAYDVERRRREVGIRIALGADQGSVLWMFVRQGLKLAAAGAAAGLVAAALATQGLRSMLFGVAPLDAVTFAGALGLLLLTVAAASYVPARRASGLDAARVLRQ